jgi:hypothetical protein
MQEQECNNTIPIALIDSAECLGDSLGKINGNFASLQNAICDLFNKINSTTVTRTFFYYGPNSDIDAASGMDNYNASIPSNWTIQSFVNDEAFLNLKNTSKKNDVAYVIYQKTGYIQTDSTGTVLSVIPSYSIYKTFAQDNANIDKIRQSLFAPPDTKNSRARSITAPVAISYNTWYNVDEYLSATASCNGGVAATSLGTIMLTFRTPDGREQNFSYTAPGNTSTTSGDDTYIDWNQSNVVYSRGYPIPKSTSNTINRPFINVSGVQFKFTKSSGNPYSWSATAVPYKASAGNNTNTKDVISYMQPTYFIWRLTADDTKTYTVDSGYPVRTNNMTADLQANTTLLAAPSAWSKF